MAVYAITLTTADGAIVPLDLDDPALADGFHAGERLEGQLYRWTRGELRVPAGLDPLLRVAYESGTLRGWSAPEPVREWPKLQVVV